MTNSERITKLIEKYSALIANDHHKSRDGYFWIDKFWDAYSEKELVPKYQAMHAGYLNELNGTKRYTEEAAEKDMIEFLEQIIADWKPEDWG